MLDFITKACVIEINLPAGPTFYLTDFPAAPGSPDAVNLVLPDFLPQKLFIVGCHARREQISAGQIVAFIDYGRNGYNTGFPPYHQSGNFANDFCDKRRWDVLNSLAAGVQESVESYSAPKLLDRSTDSIWIQNDGQAPTLYGITLSYLVPTPDQPSETPWSPNQAPPPPSGVTSIYLGELDSNVGGNTGISVRNIITVGGTAGQTFTQVRARIGAKASGAKAQHISIGPSDGGSGVIGTPVELKSSGQSGCNVPANSNQWTDWTPLSFSAGDKLAVTVDHFGATTADNVWGYRAIANCGNFSSPSPSALSAAMQGTVTAQASRIHDIAELQAQ